MFRGDDISTRFYSNLYRMFEKHKEACSCSRSQRIDWFGLDRPSAESLGVKLSSKNKKQISYLLNVITLTLLLACCCVDLHAKRQNLRTSLQVNFVIFWSLAESTVHFGLRKIGVMSAIFGWLSGIFDDFLKPSEVFSSSSEVFWSRPM